MPAETDSMSGIEVETNIPDQVAPEPKAKAPEPVEADEDQDTNTEEGEKRKSRRTRQIERLRQENEFKDRRIAELLSQAPKPKVENQAPEKSDQPPRIEDYEDVLAFTKAEARWEAKQEIKAYKDELEQKDLVKRQEAEAKELAPLIEAYEEKIEKIIPDNPEFPATIQAYQQAGLITETVERAVLKSEMPEQVALHLTKFPNDMLVLSKAKDQAEAAFYIAKIEDFISENQDSVQVKKTTASAPINPIGKKAATSTKSPLDSDDMSDWYAFERKMSPRN